MKQQIIDLANETISNPAKAELFIHQLSAIYAHSQTPRKAPPDAEVETEQVLDLVEAERHFEQAAKAFSRLWKQDDLRKLSLSRDNNVVYLDSLGQIVSVESDNDAILPFASGQNILETYFVSETQSILREGLKKCVNEQPEGILCIVPFYQNDGQQKIWALSPVKDQKKGAVACLCRIDFDWSQKAGEAIAEAFGLTKSEQDIMKALVKGQSLVALAEKRQRSVETVRTQAKSLLTKTGVRSQLELVRLFAAITMVSPDLSLPATGEPEPVAPPGSLALTLPDGRQMQVEIHGPPTGRPVVFLHNMFSGTAMTQAVLEALERNGIKLICPWRPGFGKSTPHAEEPGSPLHCFASDLKFLLDMLGIEQTIVVGHMSSAVYAAAAAALLPERIQNVAAVAGIPPFLKRRHIDCLPNFPRLFAYTARYFPKALSLLVRGTFGLLVENRVEVLFNNLFSGAKCDTRLISSPEVRALFLKDFRHVFAQGTASYEQDAILAATDWSAWLEKRAPDSMTFIHGVHDPVTPFALVQEIAETRHAIKLTPIDNAGHLVFYNEPERVIATIAEL